MSDSGHIWVARPAPGVGLLTIDRSEKRNAMTASMSAAFIGAFDAFDADPDIRVIVVTGAGDRAFSSGHDLSQVDEHDPSTLFAEEHMQAFLKPQQTLKPVIAAVNGAALAGGFCLALHADLRLAVPEAFFAIPVARIGIMPIAGQSARLPHLLSPAIVTEMVACGTRLGATRAETLGFVNRVVPPDQLMDEALSMAKTIAKGSATSIRGYKCILDATLNAGVIEATALEYKLAAEAGQGADLREGLAAFRARRDPDFTGGGA